jgi:hypothetical protein
MIDHGSRSTWGPVPSRSRLQIRKCEPPPLKQGRPTTFVLKSFHQIKQMRLQRHNRPCLVPPWSRGLGYRDKSQLWTFPPLRSIPMPNFIEISPVVWISIADTHPHTHWLLYIRCWKIIIVWCYDGVMKAWWCSDVMIWLRDDVMLWWCCVVITVSRWIHVFLVHSTLINFLIGALTQPPSQ